MPTENNTGSENIICHLGPVLFTIKLQCSMTNKSIKYYECMQSNFSMGNNTNFSFLSLFLIVFNVFAMKSLSYCIFKITINEMNLTKPSLSSSVTNSMFLPTNSTLS